MLSNEISRNATLTCLLILLILVSIARRLQDPLVEYVKIDPKCIGVGMYQHDVNAAKLRASLDGVVEECVSFVGVDLNVCSENILRYVTIICFDTHVS